MRHVQQGVSMDVIIRSAVIARDIEAINGIDSVSFESEDRWHLNDWAECIKGRRTIGLVAVDGMDPMQDVLGVCAYECMDSSSMHLLRLMVHPAFRRLGIGTEIVRSLIRRARISNRQRILAEVPERHVGCQVLLRECGFICTESCGPMDARRLVFRCDVQ